MRRTLSILTLTLMLGGISAAQASPPQPVPIEARVAGLEAQVNFLNRRMEGYRIRFITLENRVAQLEADSSPNVSHP